MFRHFLCGLTILPWLVNGVFFCRIPGLLLCLLMGLHLPSFGGLICFLEESQCPTWCEPCTSSGGFRFTAVLVSLVHPPLLHSNYPITLITTPFVNVGVGSGWDNSPEGVQRAATQHWVFLGQSCITELCWISVEIHTADIPRYGCLNNAPGFTFQAGFWL